MIGRLKLLNERMNSEVDTVNNWFKWMYRVAMEYDFEFNQEGEDNPWKVRILEHMEPVKIYLFDKYGKATLIGIDKIHQDLIEEFKENKPLKSFIDNFFKYLIWQEEYIKNATD